MYSSFRMPIIMIGSILFAMPVMPGFVTGTVSLQDFLLRYLIGLVVSAVSVSIIWNLIGGYKRANDHAAKVHMAKLREEEIARAKQQRIERQKEILKNLVESEQADSESQDN